MPSRNGSLRGELLLEGVTVDVMCALELLLDVAYHDGAPRDLAVASEAWMLAGFDLGAIDVSHGGRHEQIMERVAAARRGRPRALLHADARGVITAFRLLAREGLLPSRMTNEAKRQRWLARGGHDG